MSKIKKIIVALVLVVASVFAIGTVLPTSGQAYADDLSGYPECKCSSPTENAILNNCRQGDKLMFCDTSTDGSGVYYLLNLVKDIMLGAAAALAVIGISISGIVILTSKDDVARATKGKRRLIEVVIGVFLLICLWAIVNFLVPSGGSTPSGDMNREDPNPPASTAPSSPGSGSSTPGSGSTIPGGSTDSDPIETGDVDGWNMLCGPNPNQAVNKSKYGQRTQIYRNRNGRTFYMYKQADELWASEHAGTNSRGVVGTMSSRGCYRTAIAELFNSMGLVNYTPFDLVRDSGGMDIGTAANAARPSYSQYFSYSVYGSSSKSSWKSAIINAFNKNGAIIVRVANSNSDAYYFTKNGMHSMPAIDYKKENGKDMIYIADTITGGGTATNHSGWYDLDDLITRDRVGDKIVSLDEIDVVIPKKQNLNCLQYR